MKLAIVIEGDPNSGKTSTIREFINIFAKMNLSVMRSGWKKIYLNSIFESLKLHIYCVPSSPSETNITLSQRFNGWTADVVIVALQPNGRHYSNSLNYLRNQNYHILPHYSINNVNGNGDWERFDGTNKQVKLQNRANQINDDIRQFINNNSII